MGSGASNIDVSKAFDEAVQLHQAGKLDDAARAYGAILTSHPGHVGAPYNLGLIERGRGKPDLALKIWADVVTRSPREAHVHLAISRTCRSLGRHQQSLEAADMALKVRPDDPDALLCQGNALRSLGDVQKALKSFDKAIAARPDYALAWANRGHTLSSLREHEGAVEAYRKARKADPSMKDVVGALLADQLRICDWDGIEAGSLEITERIRQGENVDLPFSFLGHSRSAMDQLACAKVHLRDRFPSPFPPTWTGQGYDHERIRVAYVSSDLRSHAVGHLMAGLFEQHDRTRFEWHAYSLPPTTTDPVRSRISAAFDHFHDVSGWSDLKIAQHIRDAEIDIAVDLNGFTTHCHPEIFARRCAPIQINYLGFPATMGSGFTDYILGDATVTPVGLEAAYSEKIIRLPFSYQVNDSKRPIAPETPTRAEAGLPETGFVFCCFNASYKIEPSIFDIWMRLLKQVPGSVLWLYKPKEAVEGNLLAEAARRGISADRLVFASPLPLDKHLARQRLADLFLDTLPYNAHTTASDALWAGLPLLTCMGETFASRVAASILRAAGLPELVTETLEDYEAQALRLARDPLALGELRKKTEMQRDICPLFDTAQSARHLEQAYLTAWRRWRAGLKPIAFDVVP